MIVVVGDIHGNKFNLMSVLSYLVPLTSKDIVILAGDVGILYGGNKMGSLLHYMVSQPCKFIVLRGNHDDRYWKSYQERGESFVIEDMFGTQLAHQKKYPNVYYVKDEGDILTIDGMRFLMIPGAFSVDGEYRKLRGLPYCEDEQLTYQEMDNLLGRIADEAPIDYVISHTCPLSWQDQLQYVFLDFLDQSKIDKTMDKFLDAVNDALPDYKMWLFGHFHDDKKIEGANAYMLYTSPFVIETQEEKGEVQDAG